MWGPDISTGKGTFGGNTWACPDLPTVDILNVIHKGAAVTDYHYCSNMLMACYFK